MVFKKGLIPWNKGKKYTYEELMGVEKARENKQKLINARKGYKHSEETKEKMRQAQLKNPTKYFLGKHLSEKHKKKISKANKGRKRTKEFSKRHSILMKKQFANGERVTWNKNKKGCFSNDTIQKMSKSAKGKIVSKETRERQSLAQKKAFLEGRKKTCWKKGGPPEEIRRKALRALYKKPNKPETILINLIKEHNLPYDYNGNKADLIIGGKIPDFYNNNGSKQVLELFGRQFHDPDNTFLKKIDYIRTEKGTLEHYKKFHFGCLIVWEEELKDMDEVLNKILLFEKGSIL